jgi:hypothetical protein
MLLKAALFEDWRGLDGPRKPTEAALSWAGGQLRNVNSPGSGGDDFEIPPFVQTQFMLCPWSQG